MSQFDDILAKHGIQSQEQTEDDPFDAILKKHGIKGGAKEQDGALKRGWNKMVQSVGITGALASGDAESAAQKIAESARYQQANPGTPEGNELMAAWQRGDGISGGLSEVAGEFKKDWRAAPSAVQAIRSTGANLAAMGSGVVEQIPNMIPPMTGMLGGGAAGSLAGPVVMVGGAWAGASTGNTLVEGGGMAQEALHKAGINPLDTEAVKTYLAKNGDNILMQAGIKGAVIGAVDTATMGIAGKLLTGPVREATGRAMVDMGVDLTDKAAVKAAIKSPELAAKVAADPLYKAATTGAQGVTRNVTAAALEPAGEFTGEYLGQGIATGEYDAKEAFLEAASSIGQSGATFAGQKAYAALKYPFKAGKGSDASGSLPADDILTQPPSQPTAQPTNVAPQPSAAGTSPLAAPPPLNQADPGATAFPDVNEAIQADELVQADAANPVDRMAELDAESVALAARKRELNDPANGYGPMFDAERAEIFTRQMEIAQERAELELGRTAPQPDRPVDVAPPAAPLDTDAANPVDRMAELDAESVALAARKRELNDPANGYGPMFDTDRAEIFARQMEIAQERAELDLGRAAPQPAPQVDAAPPAAASMDEVRRQNEQRIQRMIDLAASRGDFEPVKTSPTGTPIVGNRPVSSIPSGRIAQVLDATTNPNERIALEREMARRGMEVPVLVEPAPPVQESAALPEDNEPPAEPAMERGDVSLSGATDNNFDVSGRTDAQLANLVKAGKPGWREAAIAESARRKTASLPVESAARTLGEDGRATDGKPINKGDVFRTLSGRNTTPYPKQKTEKYASQWLIDNATVEAESRGDDFNARMFKNSKPLKDGTLTTADREGMLMYLFSQQPDVVPSILKPLTGQAARTAEVDKTINAKPDEVSAFDQRYPNVAAAERAIKDKKLKQVAVFADGDQFRIGAKNAGKAAPSNNLIQRIKQLGGINTRYRSDVIGDKAGAPGLFSGNGKGLDDLATMLQAEGFAIDTDEAGGGVDDLTELIQRAVNGGETIMNHAGQQAAAEKKLNDDFRDNLKEEIAKLGGTPARNASTQKLVEMLNTLREKLRAEVEQESIAKAAQLEAIIGQDLTPAEWDMLLDERNAQAFDYTQDIAAIARMEQEREAANAVEREQEGEGAQTAVQRTGEGPRQGDSTRGDESQAARTEQETFGLTGQTPEEIKAKEDDRAAKAKAEQESADKAEEEAKKKRIAAEVASRQQASAENFQLGQSAEDALAGQGDIFSQPSTTVPAQKAPDSAKPATSTETPAGQPAATTKPTTSTNTVFTEDAAAKARAILKKKLGQLNSGLDPEIMQAGITLAGYHIEKGARTFAAYAKAMIEDLGDAVKPYLKSWYAAVTLDPRAAGMDGMDDLSSVQSADVEAILKETGDTHEPDKHSRANLERDRQDAGTQDGLGEDDVRAGTRRDGGDGEQGVRRTAQTQDQPAGGERVPGHEAAPDGAQGDFSPFAEAPGIEPGVAGSDLDQRSGDLGLFGQTIEPAGTEAADRVATGGTTGLDAKRKAQAAAQNVKTIPGNRENIREALPFLMDGQQDDVAFAEKRFSKPTGYGVLFTNGTGTGKTASGLGVIKRFERQGKTNTLIVVPSDKIAADWIEFAKNLKLDIAKLDDTKDAGQGIVITTYANFGANDALVRRKWDLVVADEAHYLSQAKDGDGTLALDKLRAITMSPRGAHTRFSVLYAKNLADLRGMSEKLRANFSIMNRDDTMDQMVDALRQENRKLEADISTLRAFLDQKRNEVRDEVDAAQGATRPRVTFLSATPFAYEKSIDYAEGYLFDYPADGKVGRSNQDGRSIFMVQHFGYRVRNHKLTEPGPEVNRGLMQRQFNSWLKSEGVLSGRMLDVSMDYDRKFILTESAIGKDIDRAMQWLWDQSNDQTNPNRAGYQTLSAAVHDTFDHLTRRYLLEAIKAKEAIPIIRQHLGMGRKVVVFHDFKKGGGFNPFRFSHSLVFSNEAVDGDDQKKNDQARAMAFNSAIDAFNAEFRELVDSPVWKSASPINALSAAFPDALLFNGDIPPKKRRENVAIFQDDESGKNLIIGQSAAMKEGVSLHDTTGKHPRVLINLGLPTQPTTSIQEEGRIFRVGQASNAIFRYLNTGTNWERWAFATTIAQRSSAAENLALGEEARALMDAYIQGFEESDAYPPGHEGEGTGGKERDRQATEALTEWDRAMTLYFAQHKRTSRDKSMEGVDYFATPEPLGLKMVEWADIRDGDKALEPSAGHGAIARWFPDNINRTVVEPSSELASRLKMVVGDARLLQEQFEQLNTAANKFDAVVMNPPFGVGGKTAIEHVAKAAQHLNNGGRIVALIPTGPAADKRFDKWFYGEEQRAIKPIDTLDYGIGPQEIYRGDAIKTNASWAPEAIILRKDAGGQSYWVKVEGRAGEIMVNKAAVTAHARSGPRTETFRPAESLYLRADIKLPQVTFERAGTRVAARVVVIEKQTNKDVAGNIQQINRDYTGSDDIKSFFERIKDAGIPERAAAHAPDSSAPATPAHTAQAVQGAMTGFKLAQTKHAIKGIDLFVATLEKKVEYDEYKRIEKAAKKHGGYYSNFARNGAVPGFQFETEENRKAFLDGFNKAEEPAATYISMAEKGQSPTGGTLLSRDDSGSRSIPWYSPLHRAVGSAKRDAMPGQQWKLWLQGNKSQLGLKDDELTYSGVLDYLELRGKEKVTKAEIADYLSGNGVTVQDVVKGGDRERFAVRRNPSSGGWQVRDPDGNWWGGYATEEDARAAGHNDIAENPTKFSGYWDSSYKGGIPGTYREILVTLPGLGKDKFKYAVMSLDGTRYDGPVWDSRDEAERMDALLGGGREIRALRQEGEGQFRSTHWPDTPNVLVHIRLDEVTGADGKRYVRVGEVQSDWGQKGKKEGFAKPGDASLLLEQKELRNKKDSITARWGGLRGLLVATKTDPDAVAAKAEKDAIDVRLREIEEALGNTPMTGAIRGAAPPSAPFVTDTKAWVALGIKRAIMHAVDVGADGIVFGTGEQNANLYDLSKQVDRLDIEPYGVEAGVQQYRVTAMKDGARAIDRTVAEPELSNVVGKDIAKEAIAGKTRFEGEGLRVGGEGMRAFYDQIVPQVANEVLKKIGGGKVGAVDTRPSDPNELGRWMQPGFLLPESLRTKLSENGLSLFARQPGTKGKSISLRDLTAVRDRVAARMKNLPPVHVFASPDSPGVPGNLRAFIYQQGAQNDVEGALHQGEIYLFASGLRDALRAEQVLAEHEVTHYGLLGLLGKEGKRRVLQSIWARNARIRKQAHELGKRNKINYIDATEEILADMDAKELTSLSGWRGFVLALRDWFASHGFDNLARWMNAALEGTLSDQARADLFAADLVRRARAFVENGPPMSGGLSSATALSQLRKLADDLPTQERWLNAEARMRGFKDIEDLLARDYPLFEKLAALWRKKHVVFDPTQIKSATGNNGDYSLTNPNITRSAQRDMFQEDMIGPDATVETSRPASSKGDTELGVNVNSTGRQIAPTRQALENFWKWFGNSETVDDEGRPSLYYHTTLNDFEQFEANRVTANSGTFGDWETSRAAIFFTESLDDSQAYGRSGDGFAAGANVMPVYIRAENILDMSGGYLPSFGRDAFAIEEAGLNPRYMEQFDWSKFDDEDGRHMVDALKRAGYDGIKFWDENPHTRESFLALAVFDPGQIKSALGNRGTFDPANPDIRLSRAGQSQLPGVQQSPPVQPPSQQSANLQGGAAGNQSVFNTPEPSKMDDIIFKLQDSKIDLKRAIQGITDAGRQIADKWNTYMQEELFHGRTAKRVQDFADRELAPMLREMALRKVSIADLDKYLWARHAKEANALIEQRDPGVMVDDATGQPKGSGMTDQEADDYFAGLSQDQRNQLDAIARKVDGMIARTRDLYVSYGLENRDTVQGWADMFQHYVPLMREDHDGGMGIGQGFSIKGREAKHRTGSTRAVADVLANIATQRERAIVRGEKNRVAVSLAGLVKLNQAPDFWTLDKIPQERVLNEKTGLVETREVPNYRTRDNVIIAKIKDSNGNVQERAIVLDENDERAVRLAKSMKNIDIPMLEGWLGSAAAVTRYFSAINTQYNPVFGVVNLIRDTGTGALNLSSTALKGKERAVTNPRRIASAVAGIYSDARKERKGQVGTSPWATLWEEFTEEGGQTGYRDMFRTSNERANAMQQVMDPTSWTENKWGQFFTANGALKVPLVTIQKAATPLLNWLSDFNLAMENAVRLSAYKEAVDSGMSKQQAASLAKNLTVNFNRKGAWGAQAGALYAFFNAATQGTARIGETLTRRDHVTGKYSVSGVGKKIIGGGVMLGVMQAVALAMAGYDDDEPPEFIRERNIVVPLMDGKYISIPMPLGFHVLPNIGRIATETLMGRRGSAIEGVIDLMGITFEAFNPMGSAGWSTQTVLPTVFDPMAAIIENKDWTGKPIAKEKFSNTDPEPGFAMAKDNASSVSTAIAYAINLATGGSEYTAGKISPTPDQIDYLWGQVTGGVGREGNKLYQSVESLFTGEELPPHKIPLAGRLYGNTKSSSAMNSRFYDNIRDMKRHKAEYMGRMEDGDTEGAQQYLADNPEAEMIRAVGAYESKVQQLRSAKRKAIEQGDSERAKEIEMMTGELMERFNQQIGSAKQ